MYRASSDKQWQGRVDPEDGPLGLRWHQKVKLINLIKEALPPKTQGIRFVFLGFASDEGVRRNQGRLGAVEGPFHLRKALSSLADHLPESKELWDGGDVVVSGEKLEAGQEELGRLGGKVLDAGAIPITLGGGHEVAWASFLAFTHSSYKDKKLGIINIDAHFDLRSSQEASSGTPFLQMAQWCEKADVPFAYLCLGIQRHSNTQALFKTAAQKGVSFLMADEIMGNTQGREAESLDEFLRKVDCVYLSIDLDAFDGAFAPGVSAPAVGGLSPAVVLPIIQKIARSGKLLLADMAELNPRLDHDRRTAKLGARCLFELVMGIA